MAQIKNELTTAPRGSCELTLSVFLSLSFALSLLWAVRRNQIYRMTRNASTTTLNRTATEVGGFVSLGFKRCTNSGEFTSSPVHDDGAHAAGVPFVPTAHRAPFTQKHRGQWTVLSPCTKMLCHSGLILIQNYLFFSFLSFLVVQEQFVCTKTV